MKDSIVSSDCSTKRKMSSEWSDDEIKMLIDCVLKHNQSLSISRWYSTSNVSQGIAKKGDVWNAIASYISDMCGSTRSGKACRIKFKQLEEKYKREVQYREANNYKTTWQYFSNMHTVCSVNKSELGNETRSVSENETDLSESNKVHFSNISNHSHVNPIQNGNISSSAATSLPLCSFCELYIQNMTSPKSLFINHSVPIAACRASTKRNNPSASTITHIPCVVHSYESSPCQSSFSVASSPYTDSFSSSAFSTFHPILERIELSSRRAITICNTLSVRIDHLETLIIDVVTQQKYLKQELLSLQSDRQQIPQQQIPQQQIPQQK